MLSFVVMKYTGHIIKHQKKEVKHMFNSQHKVLSDGYDLPAPSTV